MSAEVIRIPRPRREHHRCALLASLDVRAAAGDVEAAALARWHESHPGAPETAEDCAAEPDLFQILRAHG